MVGGLQGGGECISALRLEIGQERHVELAAGSVRLQGHLAPGNVRQSGQIHFAARQGLHGKFGKVARAAGHARRVGQVQGELPAPLACQVAVRLAGSA